MFEEAARSLCRAPRGRVRRLPARGACGVQGRQPGAAAVSRTPSTRRRHRSFSAQDWEDALEGQEPFAGGAAPADDGPDTQSFDKTSEKGDDDGMDDFD